MEFERALFRIHQRTLNSETVRKGRILLERILPPALAALALGLAGLHGSYVGQAHCLPDAFRRAGFWNATSGQAYLPEDVLLYLTLVEGEDLLSGLTLRMPEATPPASASLTGARNLSLMDVPAGRASVQSVDPAKIFGTYRFALDRELVQMKKSVFSSHNFETLNISLPESCLAQSWLLADALRFFDLYDGIVINELAYGLRSHGFLERLENGEDVEAWAWTSSQVESASPLEGRSLAESSIRKVLILFSSITSFLLISAVTGFFIRVAVNGSAVLMFPMAMAAQSFGANSGRLSMHVLSRSFPWIGIHVEVLRRGARPLWPLFRSHLFFLFVQSFSYLSCNLAWRFILYRKSSPEGFEERIFSLCSMIELFNLIFVRSTASAELYPKVAAACMVYLHFYIYTAFYPFHGLAFATCAGASIYAMMYCLNHFEEPALRADPFSNNTPTNAHPRALYLPILSPSWTIESAPLWTMFYPPEPSSSYTEDAMRHIQSEEYLMP